MKMKRNLLAATAIVACANVASAAAVDVSTTFDGAPTRAAYLGSFTSISGCTGFNSCRVANQGTATFGFSGSLASNEYALVSFDARQGNPGTGTNTSFDFAVSLLNGVGSGIVNLTSFIAVSYHFGPGPATGPFSLTISNTGPNDQLVVDNLSVSAVPEPASIALALAALGALGLSRKARKNDSPDVNLQGA